MVSVLFVDDSATGLKVMRDSFDGPALGWDVDFAPSPGAALELMDDSPVNAVVASSRLMGMSTADFFRLTKATYPETARIALSDPGDRGGMLSALPVANQCLSKACDPEVLARVVEKTSRLQKELFNADTRRVVADMGPLPSLPENLMALDNALSDDNCSLGDVADIISRDVALVAKVLTLVNSSFFGLRTQIADIRQAVAYLGIETLRDFAMASEAFGTFAKNPLLSESWLAAFNNHAMSVADIAGRLVRTSAAQCGASVAGMLHDIGELVVAQQDPAVLDAVAEDITRGVRADDAEHRHIGLSVPIIGAYLLSEWGMGHYIVEAIAYQREERPGPHRDPELSDVLHAADYAAMRTAVPIDLTSPTPGAGKRVPWTCPSARAEIAPEHLERVGLLGALHF